MIKVNTDSFIYNACSMIETFLINDSEVKSECFTAFVALRSSLDKKNNSFEKIQDYMGKLWHTNDDAAKAELTMLIYMYLGNIRREHFDKETLELISEARTEIPKINSFDEIKKRYGKVIHSVFLNKIYFIDASTVISKSVYADTPTKI